MNAIEYAEKMIKAKRDIQIECDKKNKESLENLRNLAESIVEPIEKYGFKIKRKNNTWQIYKNNRFNELSICDGVWVTEILLNNCYLEPRLDLTQSRYATIGYLMTDEEIENFNAQLGTFLKEYML